MVKKLLNVQERTSPETCNDPDYRRVNKSRGKNNYNCIVIGNKYNAKNYNKQIQNAMKHLEFP